MAENFGLVSKSMRPKLGRKSYFTPEGKVALMFLKMYTGLSCPKLMEQLNGNIHYQMFCDVIIDPARPLTNYKLLDDIMMELAGKLKIQQQQDLLAEMWKPYMKDLDTMYTDATCYESEMRYPNDRGRSTLMYRKRTWHTDLVRQELARVRATAMEGSFGTQKTDGTSRCYAQSENIKR